MYKLKLIPPALRDIRESLKWYDDQKKGLGRKFYIHVKARPNYIQLHPHHYQISYKNIRSAGVNRFPFQVHYILQENNKSIIILAVSHTSRSQSSWRYRSE
ncbi:type II toxin-antitoxin system RelE/ParE family toxin [Fulvivirga ligni]|uniref:type II toxin-antitoxin system RelE/ParE family toxin n=1 Tax=Fulvivirga ligni TaxID=2904246 RepID=UPI001F2B7082|nr:type II toxin-antitoxin system RelE/ParE family toxin [Fulvivirga ligni]UII23458.1 type II toxin-antitoxin system RelE/ParE family toxin [Fulvivirga ligni]